MAEDDDNDEDGVQSSEDEDESEFSIMDVVVDPETGDLSAFLPTTFDFPITPSTTSVEGFIFPDFWRRVDVSNKFDVNINVIFSYSRVLHRHK